MAFRSAATTLTTGGGSGTLNAPAGYQVGDVLVAALFLDSGGITSLTAVGWTSLGRVSLGAPDGQVAEAFYRVATGTDLFDWVLVGAAGNISAVIGAWSGRNTSSPFTFEVDTSNNSSNVPPVSISLTGGTAASGDDIALFVGLDQTVAADRFNITATGYTSRAEAEQDWAICALLTNDNVSSGATGSIAATATRASGTGNAGWIGFVVSIAADTTPIVLSAATPVAVTPQAPTVSVIQPATLAAAVPVSFAPQAPVVTAPINLAAATPVAVTPQAPSLSVIQPVSLAAATPVAVTPQAPNVSAPVSAPFVALSFAPQAPAVTVVQPVSLAAAVPVSFAPQAPTVASGSISVPAVPVLFTVHAPNVGGTLHDYYRRSRGLGRRAARN